MTIDHWDLSRRAPEAYADWKMEVANGDTMLGFLIWVATNRPDELSKAKQ